MRGPLNTVFERGHFFDEQVRDSTPPASSRDCGPSPRDGDSEFVIMSRKAWRPSTPPPSERARPSTPPGSGHRAQSQPNFRSPARRLDDYPSGSKRCALQSDSAFIARNDCLDGLYDSSCSDFSMCLFASSRALSSADVPIHVCAPDAASFAGDPISWKAILAMPDANAKRPPPIPYRYHKTTSGLGRLSP